MEEVNLSLTSPGKEVHIHSKPVYSNHFFATENGKIYR